MPKNGMAVEKPISVDSDSVGGPGNSEKGALDGAMVVFEATRGEVMTVARRVDVGRGRSSVEGAKPTPLNSFHPRVSDWIIKKAIEIKHYVGITYEGFEEEFLVLLIAIEAGSVQSSNPQRIFLLIWTKKKKKITQKANVGYEC